jgi:hypothetical protein
MLKHKKTMETNMVSKYSKFLTICIALISAFSVSAADNELSEKEQAENVQLLFNGKDLDGWKIDKWNEGGFSIVDGTIKCNGKPSMLYYEKKKDYKNFHFSADVMTKEHANSGIFFHTAYQDKGWPIGHEAQVNCSQHDPVKTGSVYIVKKYLEKAHADDQWFHYEIIVEGNKVTTKINGKVVVEYTEETNDGRRKLSSGTFGLQAHDPGSTVFYKNIKVKELAN